MRNFKMLLVAFFALIFTSHPAFAKNIEVSGDMIWGGFLDPPEITQTHSNLYLNIHQLWNYQGGIQGAFDESVMAKINLRSGKGVALPTGPWTGSIDGQSGTLQFEATVQAELDFQTNLLTIHYEAVMNHGSDGLEGWSCRIQGDVIADMSQNVFFDGTYSGSCVIANE